MTTTADEMTVTDLSLAAFLTTRGHALLRMDGRPGRRIFIFPAAAAESCRDYFAGAAVSAVAFAEHLRSLKVQISSYSL